MIAAELNSIAFLHIAFYSDMCDKVGHNGNFVLFDRS